MKPQENQDISKAHVATLDGGAVEPVSKLAAKAKNQRAELFAFRAEDKELFSKVLEPDVFADGEDAG